jgi:broad specificity phosphatase PhoE
MKGDHFYTTVWAHDLLNSSQADRKVESTTSVFERVKKLINDIEIRINNRTVLLCTHGDVASVLLCGFLGEDLKRHREIGILHTGEIRAVPMR